jgi:hypothetical protein
VRAWVVLVAVSLLALGALGAGGSYAASSSQCHGNARLRHGGAVHFSFSCGSDEPTGFRIRANRHIVSVDDPSGVYGCQRVSGRSFDCNDQHSGAPSRAHAVLHVSGDPCDPRLILRVKPRLNFDGYGHRFKLHGPC